MPEIASAAAEQTDHAHSFSAEMRSKACTNMSQGISVSRRVAGRQLRAFLTVIPFENAKAPGTLPEPQRVDTATTLRGRRN